MINVSLVGALDLASGAGLYANGAGVDGEGQTDWNNGTRCSIAFGSQQLLVYHILL